MSNGAGKGSGPRQGQYSKAQQEMYQKGYDRLWKDCTICNAKGYHWDKDPNTGKMIKTTCLLCKGTGRTKVGD